MTVTIASILIFNLAETLELQCLCSSVAFGLQKPREPNIVLAFALKFVKWTVFKTAGTFVFVKRRISRGSSGFQDLAATLR